jgi:Rifampin ADP-ribosyl transferase
MIFSARKLHRSRRWEGSTAITKPSDLARGRRKSPRCGVSKNAPLRCQRIVIGGRSCPSAGAFRECPRRRGIYIAEPTGPIMDDPNLTDKKYPSNPTKSYRSREPLRVAGGMVVDNNYLYANTPINPEPDGG